MNQTKITTTGELVPNKNIKMKLEAARSSLIKLRPHLPHPSLSEILARPYVKIIGPSLFQPSVLQPVINSPTAIFSQMKMHPADVPEEWREDYLVWLTKVRFAREFTRASLLLERGTETQPVTDPVVAGLMLYLYSGTHEFKLRQHWLETALGNPVGAWLAAEGLHTADEREQILEAVSSDSKLLWWASLIPGLGRLAVRHAQLHLDLFGGMILFENGTDDEFKSWLATVTASPLPSAVTSSLILRPDPNPCELATWLNILNHENTARYSYESVRWARYTWNAATWATLKDAVLDKVMSDRGRWRFHWLRDIQPGAAAAHIGDRRFTPLWAAELVDALELDDFAFRFCIGEQLTTSTDDQFSWGLRWLNLRWERNQRGTHV